MSGARVPAADVRYVITEGIIVGGGASVDGFRVHRAGCPVANGPRTVLVGDVTEVDQGTYEQAVAAGGPRLPSCCKPNYAVVAAQRASATGRRP